MKILKEITEKIIALQANRDYGDISEKNSELLEVLNFCYDLLSRTQKIRNSEAKAVKYCLYPNALADFVFAIITKTGKVNLRKLLRKIMFSHTQRDIAKKIGIQRQTIGSYLNKKTSISADNYEAIINATLEAPEEDQE